MLLLIIILHLVNDGRKLLQQIRHDRTHFEHTALIDVFLEALLGILVGIIRIAGLCTASPEFQVTVRLNRERTLLRPPERFDERTEQRYVDHAFRQFTELLGSHILDVDQEADHIVASAITIGRGELVLDVGTRHETQVVACLDRHVLTLDLDVAVGRTDGDTREGVHSHISPGRVDLDRALVGRAADIPDAVFVAHLHTAFEGRALIVLTVRSD